MRLSNSAATLAIGLGASLIAFVVAVAFRAAGEVPTETIARQRAAERPIPMADVVRLPDMTWMEVRDRIASGADSVIVPVGGIERNGPHVVLGKHDLIVTHLAERIARERGETLVAPTVSFVPQGGLDPPSGHMWFAGTVGISSDTFERLLHDLVVAMRAHGFRHVLLIGDSGDNQREMERVAKRLDGQNDTRVIHVAEYYGDDPWSHAFLAARGIVQSAPEFHTDLHYEAILASLSPDHVRWDARAEAGTPSVNGIPLSSLERTAALGRELIDYRVRLTLAAIAERLETN